MRGEHVLFLLVGGGNWGSSPHARGAPFGKLLKDCMDGIIPACAGSTNHGSHRLRADKDHPRMRGEHAVPASLPLRPWGSSPHARGALSAPALRMICRRIIPACAGSTQARSLWPCPLQDHPRMRGEHPRPPPMISAEEGSSPHARGAQFWALRHFWWVTHLRGMRPGSPER